MAVAALPIAQGHDLLNLVRRTASLQECAVEFYRRLLAINSLAASMNSARDLDQLRDCLRVYFKEYLSEETIWLCISESRLYKKVCLSEAQGASAEEAYPMGYGPAGSVLRSGRPIWLPNMHSLRRMARLYGFAADSQARSIMVLPVSIGGSTTACLEMMSKQAKRFDEIEYHLGVLVAAHLSSSLENVLARQELAAANARMRHHELELTQMNKMLQELAHTDEVTGLFNKRRLLERLEMEIARSRRYKEVLSCLMLDIDDFKRVNDTHGHQAGDEILRQIGRLLRHSIRVTDFVARYGGEEFTVLLPKTDAAGACQVAEKVRLKFKLNDFILPSARINLTVSVGAATFAECGTLNVHEAISLTDDALYRAKQAGKDQTAFVEQTKTA